MKTDNRAQLESTLLAIIAQAHARGVSRDGVQKYAKELALESSKILVDELYSEEPQVKSPLQRWTNSLHLRRAR